MAITIELKQEPQVPLEVEGVLPETVQELSLDDIKRQTIFHGNQKMELGEFFDVTGDPADQVMRFAGDVSRVHWIGTKMTSGRIELLGDGGRHIGSEMRGGEIHVHGRAGDWVGAEMRGGLIHVRGDAGHQVGAAYRGSARGVNRGTILVEGNVGNELGHTLRRGTIVVGGNCGDLAGFNMLAGTVLVLGDSGIRHGAGMKRGTLIFSGEKPPELLPSFRRACKCQPAFMNLLFRELERLEFPLPSTLVDAQFEMYSGDLIEGGRGEIFLRC